MRWRAGAGLDAGGRIRRGGNVKTGTKDQIAGKLHEMKGKVKQVAGQAANKPDLEAEGRVEKLAGKVQNKVGKMEKVLEK